MSETLRLRAERARLAQDRTRLVLAADAAIRAAKELMSTSAVTPLADLEIAPAAAHLAEAVRLQNELVETVRKIHRIDRELGE